jgi:hypothetical protein
MASALGVASRTRRAGAFSKVTRKSGARLVRHARCEEIEARMGTAEIAEIASIRSIGRGM